MDEFVSVLIGVYPRLKMFKSRNCLQDAASQAVPAIKRPSRLIYASYSAPFRADRGRHHRFGGVHSLRCQIVVAGHAWTITFRGQFHSGFDGGMAKEKGTDKRMAGMGVFTTDRLRHRI